MKILIVGLNFFPELTGIGKYTGEMVGWLSESGHDINVITTPPYYPGWEVRSDYKWWQYKKEEWAGVKVWRCPIWVPKSPNGIKRLLHLFTFFISSLPIIIFQNKYKPQVIFSVAPTLFSAISSLILAKFTKSKTWLHVQDFEVDAAFNLGFLKKSTLLSKFAFWLEMEIFKRFDRVSTISNSMIKLLLDKGVDENKVVMFSNWVDANKIKPIKGDANCYYKKWDISKDKKIILYSGNLGYKQGLQVLIETAKLMQDNLDILFVNVGDGVAREHLINKAKGLTNVKFFPLQPYDKLNELLNFADIHVLPQRADVEDLVMPSKLSGMLASGKPVVAITSRESELGKIVENIGVVSPLGDSKKLSKNLLNLIDFPEKRNELGRKGREWVISQWEKDGVLKNFEKNLEELIL